MDAFFREIFQDNEELSNKQPVCVDMTDECEKNGFPCHAVNDLDFVVWRHPSERERIEMYIRGNVTTSYKELFLKEGDNLHFLHDQFGLEFSERDGDKPRVNQTGDAGEF